MPDKTVSQSSRGAETVKALVEAKIQAALAKPKPEVATMPIAGVPNAWNVWAYGLFLVPAPGHPLAPHKMVKVDDTFYVATIVWFNPSGAPSPCSLITSLASTIEISYSTGNLKNWALGPAGMNVVSSLPVVPNQCTYVDIKGWTAAPGDEGLYEMNISVHVPGPTPAAHPPLAGFATRIFDIDPDLFYPSAPGVPSRWEFDIPLRFMIYP
jgi:hypothetical protein